MRTEIRKNIRHSGVNWSVLLVETDSKGKRKVTVYSDPDTKKPFKTKKAAQQYKTEIDNAIGTKSLVRRSLITLEEWNQKFLETKGITLKPATVSSYEKNIRVHINPALGKIPIQDLEVQDINTFSGLLLSSGRRVFSHSKKEGLSERTVQYIQTILQASLEEAVRQGLLVRNVAKLATKPKVQRDPERVKFWTPEELAIFLEAIKGHELERLFRFYAFTGCRRGEALFLTERDIDFNAGTVTFRGTVGKIDGKQAIGSNKSDRSFRKIRVDKELLKLLDLELQQRAKERKALGIGYKDKNLVFAEVDGDYLHSERPTRIFREIVSNLDLPKITLHNLRTTHSSILLAEGFSVNYVAKRIGDDPATVMKYYAEILPSEETEAIERFSSTISAATKRRESKLLS